MNSSIMVKTGVIVLVEGAHTYHYAANISKELQFRQEDLGKTIVDIA